MNRHKFDDDAATPSLEEFLEVYDKDDNVWWVLGCGHHMNLFDEAIEVKRELQKTVTKAGERIKELEEIATTWGQLRELDGELVQARTRAQELEEALGKAIDKIQKLQEERNKIAREATDLRDRLEAVNAENRKFWRQREEARTERDIAQTQAKEWEDRYNDELAQRVAEGGDEL